MGNSQCDVSIIVPVYNVEKYLRRCLDSLVNQDCDCCYEIIVVNDGSKDGSLAIVKEYAEKYDFIKLFSQENSGQAVARNKGIELACGEYVMFVDSDDFVSPRYISRLYGTAVAFDCDIVQCNYRNHGEKESQKPSGMNNIFVHKQGVYSGKKIFAESLMDITVRSYVWNKIYRRSLFTQNSIVFPPGMYFEDLAIVPRLFYHSARVAFISDTLYYYVHRPGSTTGGMSKKKIADYMKAYGSLRVFMDNCDVYPEYSFFYGFLRRKMSVTIYGMLLRCWWNDPVGTMVMSSHKRTRKYLKLCCVKRNGERKAVKKL